MASCWRCRGRTAATTRSRSTTGANDRLTQLTFDAANHRFPIWTPDGQRIIYSSDAGHPGVHNIYWQRVRRLRTGRSPHRESRTTRVATSIDPRGTSILFSEFAGAGRLDVWSLPLVEANGKPGAARPLLVNTPAFETHGTFSPDGKLVAYMSSEQGAFEIYVRTFDGAGGPWRVSTAGGAHPTWSKNTQELIYVSRRSDHDGQVPLQARRVRTTSARAPGRRCATRLPARRGSMRSIQTASASSSPPPTPPRRPDLRHGDVRLQFLRRAAAAAADGSVGSTSPQQFACRDRSAHWQQRGR